MHAFPILLLILAFYGAVVNFDYARTLLVSVRIPHIAEGSVTHDMPPQTLLFGGDVLLGRRVETLMEGEQALKPLQNLHELFSAHDWVLINLEGTIPERHEHTPDLVTRFSMPSTTVPYLKGAGVDAVSLANNHAYDYGNDGFHATVNTLHEGGIVPLGHPQNRAESRSFIREFGKTRVAFIPLHATEGYDAVAVTEAVSSTIPISDIQIAFIHWGTEYVLTHNSEQEKLAYLLIDLGVDAVIGHHPHVIQDIELYDGVPIFYSLGNLVFDQYFSDAVQEGYLLSMKIEEEELSYTLYPYEMRTTRSQPTLMEGANRTRVIDTLLTKHYFTDANREDASFRVPR